MNWLYTLWFGYVWPSLKGNGPEALVQTVVYGVIAVVVYPPLRRWLMGEIHQVRDKLTHNAQVLHHIVEHHPDIPPLPEQETP